MFPINTALTVKLCNVLANTSHCQYSVWLYFSYLKSSHNTHCTKIQISPSLTVNDVKDMPDKSGSSLFEKEAATLCEVEQNTA